MQKRLLIHDLQGDLADWGDAPEGTLIFAASPAVRHCIGCFGCWVQTPGRCVIHDRAEVLPGMLAACDVLVLVSRWVYGGYSPDIKAALDRSIGYILPYFRIVGGEMHHTMRYDNPFAFTVHFYGEALTEAEQALSRTLVAANAVNMGAGSHRVDFYETVEAIRGVLV